MNASPPHVQLLYGNQQLRIDETIERLTQQILDGRDEEMSLQRFDIVELLKESAEETIEDKIDHFRLSCDTLPFLSDRKVIHLHHLEKIKSPKGKKKQESGGNVSPSGNRLYEAILQYISNPPDYCWFILTATATREQDISSPLLKAIKRQGKIHQKFVAYDDDNPVVWVVERGRQKSLMLSKGVAQLLVELVGNDLSTLDQELEKLSLLRGQKTRLSEEDLLENVQGNKHFSIFRITQSLSQKKLVPALETLEQIMLESSSEHIKLFVLISQNFQKLLKLQYFFQQRLDEATILSKLGLHPYLGKRLITQARLFTLDELERIVIELASLDLKFKFYARDAHSLFQNLFQRICSGSFQRQ